ncbi:hypothetical protein D0Z07_7177 [Hyphodiscus hymeniophilus]|uniref:G-protein coupled receptors family 2 profile 2 domain-containing protein n=1 Tax=Hyphodiscus hymeniophilus TaxID=353542 RepID=A0A9P6VFY8_9HELO|nr:hypothetical protein D0Z07_7177 [Hyphodiscus hymeniophilus]
MAVVFTSLDVLGSMQAVRSTVDTTSGFTSSSLDPLPNDIRHGMIAMGIIGLFSSVSTVALFSFITYRMVAWRKYYDHPIASNQIFVLIYNLLLADLQQALSFLFAFHWVAQNRLVGPTTACFAQGWLIQIGDVSSGLWVLSIGVHTFVNLVLQKSIPMKLFIALVIAIWAFCLILTAIGPITHRDDFFVPAGAWCWINSKHESARLYLHYVWIFLAEVGSVVIYTAVFFVLRGRLADVVVKQHSAGLSSSNQNGNEEFKGAGGLTTTTVVTTSATDAFQASRQRISKAARYMVVYPSAYVALTLPLAAGRVAAMTGRDVPTMYLAVAGSVIASCGFIDVILYISTRKALVRSSVGVKSDRRNTGNELAHSYSRRNGERDVIRMEGLQDAAKERGRPRMPTGTIVVSKSVMRSEDSFGTTAEMSPAISRSESLKSLVEKR